MTLVCALCVLALLYAEATDSRRLRVAAKLGASAAFVALGLARHSPWRFDTWICIGLVLGAAGDAALLGRGSRAFLAGLALFLAGHVAYVVAIAALLDPGLWTSFAGTYALLPMAGGIGALVYLWPRLGPMRGPVIAYVAAISAMVLGALAVCRVGILPGRFAIGACLFFVSDLAVARDKFVAPGLPNKLWGLPAYYAAQLLIASSL